MGIRLTPDSQVVVYLSPYSQEAGKAHPCYYDETEDKWDKTYAPNPMMPDVRMAHKIEKYGSAHVLLILRYPAKTHAKKQTKELSPVFAMSLRALINYKQTLSVHFGLEIYLFQSMS